MPTSVLRQMNGPTSNDVGSSLSGGNSGSRSAFSGRRFGSELVIVAHPSESATVYEPAISAWHLPAIHVSVACLIKRGLATDPLVRAVLVHHPGRGPPDGRLRSSCRHRSSAT